MDSGGCPAVLVRERFPEGAEGAKGGLAPTIASWSIPHAGTAVAWHRRNTGNGQLCRCPICRRAGLVVVTAICHFAGWYETMAKIEDRGLRARLKPGRPVTLVLGAGVNRARGVPLWTDLMREAWKLVGVQFAFEQIFDALRWRVGEEATRRELGLRPRARKLEARLVTNEQRASALFADLLRKILYRGRPMTCKRTGGAYSVSVAPTRYVLGSSIRGGRPLAREACRSSTGPGRCMRRG